MDMTTLLFALLLIAGAGGYAGYRYFRAWLVARGPRLIVCPETHTPEEVRLDAHDAAKWAALSGEPAMRLNSCSRWPERRDCDQKCLYQIENREDGCRVSTILQDWYRGKNCAYCSRWFEAIHWHDHKPAFLRKADRKLLAWEDVATKALPELFSEADPVCWDCYIAESFRQMHPELVTDRPKPPMYHA